MFRFRHKSFIISVAEVFRPPPIMGVSTNVNVPINTFAYQTHGGGNLKVSATVGNRSLPGGC